ncbi:MAG TPA: 16S rRNA (cytidine(1402)-2'-O)-methyltransferase [Bacteroidota bacterium]|nr:16S rRNA (cytidine(1402)-2'-O)-methyltransferase [Bacteroidota bacterium]
MDQTGILYLVATPIGNYADITFRAVDVLKSVDVVVYEERKEGNRLLRHLGIEKPVESLNEHNEQAATFHILDFLKTGKNVAVISDCGTPVFSDPGQLLVRKAVELKIRVVPIPGASSLMPALTVSGFSIDQFIYYGWLSPKRPRRLAELEQLRRERRTIVLMDTPYRLLALLKDIADVFGTERKLCVAFDLTLPGEEIFHGTAVSLYQKLSAEERKGEFVVVIDRLK